MQTKFIAISCGLLALAILVGKVSADVMSKPQVQASATPSAPAEPSPTPSATQSSAPIETPQAAAPLQAPTMPTVAPTNSAIAAVIVQEATALKAEANAESQTLTLFHQGQVVTVLQVAPIGQWQQVSANGIVGFVQSGSLSQPTKLSGAVREYVPQPQLAL